MSKKVKILLGITLFLVVIQLFPVNRTLEPISAEKDFVQIKNTPPEIRKLLKNSCYDCHSFETKYPKYAYVAPISWVIQHHIKEGREHANFSTWANYNAESQKTILLNSIKTIENQEMPMPGYLAPHPEAQLTNAERKKLANYFREVMEEKEIK